MKEKKVTIYNSNNHAFEANLLLCFEIPEINNKYIVYNFPTLEDDVTINVGKLKESSNNEYYIKELDNEEEWNLIRKIMLEIVKES